MSFSMLSVVLVVIAVGHVQGHGMLTKPPARNYMWRLPEFADKQPPFYNDQQVWCNNVKQAEDIPRSTCGVCGDPADGPQELALGGKFGLGIIGGTYQSGSVIDVDVEFNAPHHGSFSFDLCDNDSEEDSCFKAHKLDIIGGNNGTARYCIGIETDVWQYVHTKIQLPAGVTCSRCTLRWTYRTSYPKDPTVWDQCYEKEPTQVFRNCADIAIV